MVKRTRNIAPRNIYKQSPIKNYEKLKGFNEYAPLKDYDKIMSRIYLGNMESANDSEFFKNKNITAVLNCTNDVPNYFKKSDIEYMRIPVEDSLKVYDYNRMYNFIHMAADFIYKHVVLQSKNILVHCVQGRQRSAICVAAFLVKYHNKTPYEACSIILKKRPEAFHFGHSLNFEQTLEEYYKDIQRCDFKPRQPKFKKDS